MSYRITALADLDRSGTGDGQHYGTGVLPVRADPPLRGVPAGPVAPGQPVCGTRPAGMTPSLPFWKSSNACMSSSRVFITNGP